MDKKELLAELDTLVAYLDESTDLFCKRLDFMRTGDKNKAKFINERILPTIDNKIRQQTERVSKLLSQPKPI